MTHILIEYVETRYAQGPIVELYANKSSGKARAELACVQECEAENPGNTEELAKCMTQCATQQSSVLLLGCVVQCTIGNWATAEMFIGCIHECLEKNTTRTVSARNVTNSANLLGIVTMQ